jgi:hypothetical protein
MEKGREKGGKWDRKKRKIKDERKVIRKRVK